MFSGNSPSLADIAAVTGNNKDDGFFGGEGIWAIIIFAMIFGYGGFGYGGFGGMGGANNPGLQGIATRADINEGFALNDIQNGIRGIQQGICDSTYALNNSIQNGFNNVNVAMLQGFNNTNVALMQGQNALQSQLANCCCETREAIQGVNYNMATQACETRQAIVDSTRQVLDFLVNDKIATLTAENNDLRRAASQDRQNALLTTEMNAQTQQIINAVRPTPVPSFPASNLYGYGYNGCCNNACCA